MKWSELVDGNTFKIKHYDISLWASDEEVSAQPGGVVNFDLVATSRDAGKLYLLAGSITGTDPGVMIGSVFLPLIPDDYMFASAGSVLLPGSIGLLDAVGSGQAQFNLPPVVGAGFIGTTFHHAYLVFDEGLVPSFASNPRGILMNP